MCENDTAIDFGIEVGNQGEHATGSFAVKFQLDGYTVGTPALTITQVAH